VLLAVAVLVAGLVAAIPAPASAEEAPCPTEGVPFTGELTNGVVQIGNLRPATGATATTCGVVDFAPDLSLQARVPRENLTFAELDVPIALFGLISVPVQLTAASDFTGPVAFQADGAHLRLTGEVVATARVLLASCQLGPFRVSLTTDVSGQLVGRPLAPAGDGSSVLRGSLVGNEDAIPAGRPSLRCGLILTALLNTIIGLPAEPGESSISFDASLVLSPQAQAALQERAAGR
jgi:hypothetical protein